VSVLETIGTLFTSGGVTGLVSGGIAVFGKLAEKRIDNSHTVKKWAYELQMIRENAKHESILADKNLLIEKQVGADAMRLGAIQAEAALTSTSVHKWVNDVRSLHRIVLTYVLIIAAMYMNFADTQQTILLVFVTNSAAGAVGFWFGDRIIAPVVKR